MTPPLVFNHLNVMFMEFVRNESMTLDALLAEVAAQTGPLARLISTERGA